MDNFVEVVDTNTGITQRVPREWLGDPVLGRFIAKTPNQRALDGELGQVPDEDATIDDLRNFAKDADIDLGGAKKKADIRGRILEQVGGEQLPDPQPPGVDVEVGSGPVEPLDRPAGVGDATVADTTSTDADPATAETPSAGDQGVN